jgi:hypothetical protein
MQLRRCADTPAEALALLRPSVEDNLRNLGVGQLAVVNLRRLDVGPGLAAEGDQVVDGRRRPVRGELLSVFSAFVEELRRPPASRTVIMVRISRWVGCVRRSLTGQYSPVTLPKWPP